MLDKSGWPVESHFFCGECNNCTRTLPGQPGEDNEVQLLPEKMLIDCVLPSMRAKMTERVMRRTNMSPEMRRVIMAQIRAIEREEKLSVRARMEA